MFTTIKDLAIVASVPAALTIAGAVYDAALNRWWYR